MFKVEQYQHIRELYTAKGYSQRQIAKILGISRNTVRKYCQGACLPFEKSSRKRQPSVMTPKIMNFIKECLKMDEEEGLPKQSHTAKRIYDRIVKELGFNSVCNSRNTLCISGHPCKSASTLLRWSTSLKILPTIETIDLISLSLLCFLMWHL